MTTLGVHGLTKWFGRTPVVRGISFSVSTGEMVALIGPNGAGKSTTFAMLGGQLRPDAGRVELSGRDITGVSPARLCKSGVGRTFQITSVFGSMTVLENAQTALMARAGKIWRFVHPARDIGRGDAMSLLESVGLAAQAGEAAALLAYGDLKRLDLALALASQPSLLLMDEPTAGMAVDERASLMHLVRDLVRRQRLAVLFTEHDMDMVFGFADRVLVMEAGQLVASGDPAAVRRDPLVRAMYLGSE